MLYARCAMCQIYTHMWQNKGKANRWLSKMLDHHMHATWTASMHHLHYFSKSIAQEKQEQRHSSKSLRPRYVFWWRCCLALPSRTELLDLPMLEVQGSGFSFNLSHISIVCGRCQLKQIWIYTILPCSLPLCYKLLPLAGAQTCRRWHFVSQRNPNIPGETPTLNPFNCCILFPSQSFSFFTPQTWIRPFL